MLGTGLGDTISAAPYIGRSFNPAGHPEGAITCLFPTRPCSPGIPRRTPASTFLDTAANTTVSPLYPCCAWGWAWRAPATHDHRRGPPLFAGWFRKHFGLYTRKPRMAELDLDRFWSAELDEHASVAAATAAALKAPFGRLVAACVGSLRAGGKLLFFGNGGSAGDAQHLATELTVRYVGDRPAIAAIALTTDSSALTAIGNDLGFEMLFARQIEALGRRGDVAIGITTSGKSPNVLRGLEMAKARGLVAAALSGKGGGPVAALADPCLTVPSATTARIQEMHIMLGQMLCGAIEHGLGFTGDGS